MRTPQQAVHYRECAEECRVIAEYHHDADTRRI
jgi:hypothetical protein